MKTYNRLNTLVGWIVFAVAAVVYLMTIEPTASFWDCGEFIVSSNKLEVGHPPGAPIFMLIANVCSNLTSDTALVAKMINSMSAIMSALTILFLFWTITFLVKKVVWKEDKEITRGQIITILGSGIVGALVYTFSDTFWFSAVEAEVYATSSFFTALVFWLILKWDSVADEPRNERWIVLIAYLIGLSIGVHLLNLLCIPAIGLVYYFRRYKETSFKGAVVALLISFGLIAAILFGVIQGLIEIAGIFELFSVNTLGLPYNSGAFIYLIVLAGLIAWGIWESQKESPSPLRAKIAFFLTFIISGIPFIGNGYLFGIIIILLVGYFLYRSKKINYKLINTTILCLAVIVIGYSSFALILIRSNANTPMNQNHPADIFTLRSYLAREQYGSTPLFYGPTFVSEMQREAKDGMCVAVEKDARPNWAPIMKKNDSEKDRYYVASYSREAKYVPELNTIFPRMYKTDEDFKEGYKSWGDVKGTPVSVKNCGDIKKVMKPTFAENLRYFFSYQVNFMYWRYFMWNFSGRQNDIQGQGELTHGNWITGIKFIDSFLIGPQEDMPYEMEHNPGRNVYYMLPLLLGLLGLFFQTYADKKGIQSFWITFFLFFMTGLAIVIYLNQNPGQVRERDYAYAGSFYAFSIWIGFGVTGLAELFRKKLKMSGTVAGILATVLAILVPIQMAGQNWDDHDRSGRYMAREFAKNYLKSCEPNAILFTNGDNDTFPLWYVQEVEGFRTDVRICNTSYLQTGWYADQMKKQAYDSASLPITWKSSEYAGDKNSVAYILPLTNAPISFRAALDFVRSEDPRTKTLPGYKEDLSFIPSNKLFMPIDSGVTLRTNTVREEDRPFLVDTISVDLEGKNALGFHEMMVYEILQSNNWERPIYYANTVSPSQFMRLDPYLMAVGMDFRLVPLDFKKRGHSVDLEKSYDLIMNQFEWGGADDPNVYLDENVRRMIRGHRQTLFGRLAKGLIAEGQNERAIEVVDRCLELFPHERIPMDYSALVLADAYMDAGAKEKALSTYKQIADNSLRNLNWYFRCNDEKLLNLTQEIELDLSLLARSARQIITLDTEQGKKYDAKLREYYIMYTTIEK